MLNCSMCTAEHVAGSIRDLHADVRGPRDAGDGLPARGRLLQLQHRHRGPHHRAPQAYPVQRTLSQRVRFSVVL